MPPSTSGITTGTAPSGVWAAARSVVHEARKAAASYRDRAVGAKTPMSPVQPRRSSRWGQSVGTVMKLSMVDHRVFSTSLATGSLEQSNQAARSMPAETTRAVAAARRASSSPGKPSTSA